MPDRQFSNFINIANPDETRSRRYLWNVRSHASRSSRSPARIARAETEGRRSRTLRQSSGAGLSPQSNDQLSTQELQEDDAQSNTLGDSGAPAPYLLDSDQYPQEYRRAIQYCEHKQDICALSPLRPYVTHTSLTLTLSSHLSVSGLYPLSQFARRTWPQPVTMVPTTFTSTRTAPCASPIFSTL